MNTTSPKSLEELHVLVVDDNPDSRDFLQLFLEAQVRHVDTAENGRKALKRLEVHQYDVVFMDCQMPEMDGYEATRILRQCEGEVLHTQVIGLTANDVAGNREKCLAVGMDAFLSKPVLIGDVVATLEQVTDPES